MKNTSLFLVVILLCGACSDALGDATVDHADRGAFNSSNALTGDWKVVGGSYQARAIDGIAIGQTSGVSYEVTRNYTVFDLSSLSGTATGATLEMYLDNNGYQSSAAMETLGLFPVSTDPAELLAGNAGASPGTVFPDLGTGTPYGSMTISNSDEGSYVTADLTAALTDINVAIGNGNWSVGGAITSIDATFESFLERVFNASGTGDPATRLVLTGSVVPEPSSMVLMTLAAAAVLGKSRRAGRV